MSSLVRGRTPGKLNKKEEEKKNNPSWPSFEPSLPQNLFFQKKGFEEHMSDEDSLERRRRERGKCVGLE